MEISRMPRSIPPSTHDKIHLSRSSRWFLLLIVFWFGAQFFIFGKYSFVQVGDELDSVYSLLMGLKYSDQARSLWYPLAAGGSDQLAIGYSPDFDRILVQALPGWLAYQILHLLQLAAAVIGVYGLARHTFAMEAEGALFAAFATGMSQQLLNLHGAAIAFMPILLLSISWLLEDPHRMQRWLAALIAATIYATTSHIQYLIGFSFLVIAIWFLVANRRNALRDWAIIGTIALVIVLWRFQDVLALLYNAPYSHRASWVTYKLSLTEALKEGAERLASSFNPLKIFPTTDYYFAFFSMPILAWAAVIGLFASWKTNAAARRLSITIGAFMAVDLFLPVLKSLVYDILPPIRGFSIDKLWVISNFTLFLGAGFAFQLFLAWVPRRINASSSVARRLILLAPILTLLIFNFVARYLYVAIQWIGNGNYVQIYESPVLESLAQRIRSSNEPSRVTLYQMYDSFAQGYGMETLGGVLVLFSKRYSDYYNKLYEPSRGIDPGVDWIREHRSQTMNLGMFVSVEDKAPERALAERFHLNLISLANVRYFVSRDRLTDSQFIAVGPAGPATPWSALGRWEKTKVSLAANFTGRTHLYVYENTEVIPRFFLAEKSAVYETRASALDAMVQLSTKELQRTVVLAKEDARTDFDLDEKFTTDGSIRIQSYGAERIELEVTGRGPSLLVATNSFSPYWTCRVDGVPTPVIPAYTTFWAVRLPEAARSVVFSYEPPYRFR